jgi:fumarylacetoacetate (FAA) hydrolase family protein
MASTASSSTALDLQACLPDDLLNALLVGRVWRPGAIAGPSVVLVRGGLVLDVTARCATTADLLDLPDPAQWARHVEGESLGPVQDLLVNSLDGGDPSRPTLLAPCDLQAIKACGVTFAVSLLERVLEEQAGGDPARARDLRAALQASLGGEVSSLQPGSEAAQRLKATLQARGAWSQYLEVGIGPDAEVFTKAQPMSAVGWGAAVGLAPASEWNNPEPEVVLAVSSRGQVQGASLGNDVNLRDVEGRSALLLGKAKDNNASCAIGPFIRLFDGQAFTLDSVRQARVSLRIEGGDDGFRLDGESNMAQISRDPLDLVAQTMGTHHQYPDGVMLFLGTMFSPIQDRHHAGGGFTHVLGDRVLIRTPALGTLFNTVGLSTTLPPWTFGARALLRNLAARGLLQDR